jgi:methylmalonyl-CoA/ethylmalonyl-CoA epimerase
MADVMNVLGINHLGIAAKDPAKFKWFFGTVLGLDHIGFETVKEQKTVTNMYRSANHPPLKEPRLELLEPMNNELESPIAKYLDKKGGGIHHIAFSVVDVLEAISIAKKHSVRMIDEVPRAGAHNTKIAFVHPESTGGVLVEFVQES